MLMMKIRDVLIGFVVSAIVVGIAVSCGGGSGSSGPSGPATYTVSGALSGATGTIVLKLNGGSDMSMGNGSFTFATMLANNDFYNVQAADGKPYFIPATTSLTVAGGQIAAVSAGEFYFQVATAAYPAGELRGQINLQGGVLAGVSNMDFAQEVSPPGTCTGKTTTGQGMVIVDRDTSKITVSYMTHDVTTAHLAHIH